ncbi:hypothetical protein [Virgibacillus necropolis]|uniref:Uncharacterized protein n=1 Tax=Virgibacillus necropolis TaxID=163877 RepID=A0A221MBI4_9BACI|nr:hypothetical protein [Virgibacillus necropolis]ASN05005.1 hypothetical protein CFK40_08265 [Virgibacillus necropolis]
MKSEFDGTANEQFIQTLDELKSQESTLLKEQALQQASTIMDNENGMATLLELAEQYDQAGIFNGSPWENPSKLQANLVGGSFKADDPYPLFEVLSELRMLAIANNHYKHPKATAEFANDYLNQVMALNLDLLFPKETEETRVQQGDSLTRGHTLFKFLGSELSLSAFSTKLVDELDRLAAQRPIMVDRIVSIIQHAKNMLTSDLKASERKAIEYYVNALNAPSTLSKKYNNITEYGSELKDLATKEINKEAKELAKIMRATGLVAPHHAVFIRFLNDTEPEKISKALALSEKGQANLNEHLSLINKLIDVAVHPATCQTLYGLALMLERGVLSSAPVIPGFERMLELELLPDVEEMLFISKDYPKEMTASGILTAGLISVFGQPLGVGQGLNPTCQSARGISLWAQHDPGYLMELIARAGRDGDIDMMFEGIEIHSENLVGGLAPDLHKKLDPVSLILVPHLDRIYDDMMRRVAIRGEDGHKWTNPAFYGQWISNEFSAAVNSLGGVTDFANFVRLFYATHHPDYNEQHQLIYPNPVGTFVTTANADLLGLHAISIQRIACDSKGQYRVYFYNPNNDSGQNWGQGIRSTVRAHGEEEGEASLPFHEFASRIYAFHYNPNEMGDLQDVSQEIIDRITSLARESWGKNYTWMDLNALYPNNL